MSQPTAPEVAAIEEETQAQIRAILLADPIWSAYALADLQPAYEPHCRWGTITTRGLDQRERTGLALLFDGLKPPILLTVGEPDLVRWLLDDWALDRALPNVVYLSVREEHEPAVQTWYDNAGDRRPMTRMALTGDISLPTALAPGVVRLGPEAADGIATLYAHGGPFTPDAFAPAQLADGVFFGVAAEDGGLLAVGGTHIVDRTSGVAALGNMYTHPAARGQGHAGAILAALVATLRTEGLSTIVLNVDRRNATAIRLYERHGFTVHCPFLEGKARRI